MQIKMELLDLPDEILETICQTVSTQTLKSWMNVAKKPNTVCREIYEEKTKYATILSYIVYAYLVQPVIVGKPNKILSLKVSDKFGNNLSNYNLDQVLKLITTEGLNRNRVALDQVNIHLIFIINNQSKIQYDLHTIGETINKITEVFDVDYDFSDKLNKPKFNKIYNRITELV